MRIDIVRRPAKWAGLLGALVLCAPIGSNSAIDYYRYNRLNTGNTIAGAYLCYPGRSEEVSVFGEAACRWEIVCSFKQQYRHIKPDIRTQVICPKLRGLGCKESHDEGRLRSGAICRLPIVGENENLGRILADRVIMRQRYEYYKWRYNGKSHNVALRLSNYPSWSFDIFDERAVRRQPKPPYWAMCDAPISAVLKADGARETVGYIHTDIVPVEITDDLEHALEQWDNDVWTTGSLENQWRSVLASYARTRQGFPKRFDKPESASGPWPWLTGRSSSIYARVGYRASDEFSVCRITDQRNTLVKYLAKLGGNPNKRLLRVDWSPSVPAP